MVERGLISCVTFVGSLTLGGAVALAQAPAAIVEEVESKSAGVQIMDYVAPGAVLQLAANERIVLGYLRSCWRERITEGTITIGAQQSEVKNGKVERTKVACDAGHITLSREQVKASGAMAFRKPPGKDVLAKPEATIYGLSPIIEMKVAGRLEIERLDQKEDRIAIDVATPQLQHGVFFDLASTDRTLIAGGVYRVSLGDKQLIFKVDSSAAKPGGAPVVGRLLRLWPNS